MKFCECEDLFVHMKGQIFEVPNKSQLPGEQHPGFQAASHDTSIIRQAEHGGREWLLCCWMEVLQAQHPGLCPFAFLASLCPSRAHTRTAELSSGGHCWSLAAVVIWIHEYIHIWATCVPKTLNLKWTRIWGKEVSVLPISWMRSCQEKCSQVFVMLSVKSCSLVF